MSRHLLRVLTVATVAAAVAAAWLFMSFRSNASITLEMDRDLPRSVARGFYPSERNGSETFAWTGDRAELALAGLDRRDPWACTLRYRGGRPDPATLPEVVVTTDGVVAVRATAVNEWTDLELTVPPRPALPGTTIAIVLSNAFVPGPGDPRRLGIVVDRVTCAPVSGGARPSAAAAAAAAVGGAAFGGALALLGLPWAAAAAVTVLIAAGQVYLLSSGLAPYGSYPSRVVWSGLWIACLAVIFAWLVERVRGERLSTPAKLVILFSAAALHLKILGLLHPSKLIIDAVFHAHRLDWVLSGRYLFTQGMPGGVSFPYAIGLYVFASPWTWLTDDYVSLLRIVVSSAEVVAGALLYALIVRTSGDRLAGLMAVVLYHCVPLPYGIVGNANMTNVFGQAAALAAVVTMALYPGEDRRIRFRVGAFAVCALAFLSHISTFTQLCVTLTALGVLFWWRGGDALRRPGRLVVLTAVAAGVFAVVVYYGHFTDVYRTAWRARTQAAVASQKGGPPRTAAIPERPSASGAGVATRTANALRLTGTEIGWPILLLAGVGVWQISLRGLRDRLSLTIAALAATYLAFLMASTLMRVEAPFERYAAEFVGRVVLATFPAACMLAAIGAAWAWRAGSVLRIGSALCLLAALWIGARAWAAWL
jgi:hypothetical protein